MEILIICLCLVLLMMTSLVMLVVLLLRRQRSSGGTAEQKLKGAFASFQIQKFLARGNMADIYLARDKSGQAVALKALRPTHYSDTEVIRRFFHEGELLNAIHRVSRLAPLPACLEIGQEPKTQRPYLALTYIEGQPLSKMLESGRKFTAAEIAAVASDLCTALDAVHSLGYCHHDVSADNILVQSSHATITGASLIDFGVACRENTRTAVTFGKPLYMSPEQCRDELVTRASDLYSLGIVLYQMAVGRPPYISRTNNPVEIMEMHKSAVLSIPPGVEEPLRGVLSALLSKQPAQRPRSAGEVRARLTASAHAVASVPQSHPTTQFVNQNGALLHAQDVPFQGNGPKELMPSESRSLESGMLNKKPVEDGHNFPLDQIPELPNLNSPGLRTPSQDRIYKEPSDDGDEFRKPEIFPSETVQLGSGKGENPRDELGLPSLSEVKRKEFQKQEPSSRDPVSEKKRPGSEEKREEISFLQEALINAGGLSDPGSNVLTVKQPIAPIIVPRQPNQRRGLIQMAMAGIGVLGVVFAALLFMALKPYLAGHYPPPPKKVWVTVCSASHKIPNQFCESYHTVHQEEFLEGNEPKRGNLADICSVHTKLAALPPVMVTVKVCSVSHKRPSPYCALYHTVHEEKFIAGKEPKEGNPDDICKVHLTLPPVAKIKVRVCSVSHKLPNPYCHLYHTIHEETFIKGEEPKKGNPDDICKVHKLPPAIKIKVRICSVSQRLPNPYCHFYHTIVSVTYVKGQEPKDICGIHKKPVIKPVIKYVYMMQCPKDKTELYRADAKFCPNHHVPLIRVRVPKK